MLDIIIRFDLIFDILIKLIVVEYVKKHFFRTDCAWLYASFFYWSLCKFFLLKLNNCYTYNLKKKVSNCSPTPQNP